MALIYSLYPIPPFCMKKRLLLYSLLLCLAPLKIHAQCQAMELGTLQSLQRADYDQKQFQIQRLGFDLRSTVEVEGATVRRYFKCWHTTMPDGTAIFDQVLLWNVEVNTLVFATRDKDHFKSLRDSIESRHGNTGGNLDFYVGQQFFYRFSTQQIDGMEYFSVLISNRQ